MMVFLFAFLFACSGDENLNTENLTESTVEIIDTITIEEEPLFCNEQVVVGAERMDAYLNLLKGKNVAVIANPSSLVNETHLVDTLLKSDVDLVKVFSPEHGFRGDADAGEKVTDGKDPKSGLPIISLYGKHKKPTAEDLDGIDVLLFDLQDVGVRFYTYISTMTYAMEAAAENDVEFIVLDRPNPNGHYVDGPVLEAGNESFIGMHQVPVVHGMTVGEYAKMVNEQGWLKNNVNCDLNVITIEGWDHTKFYEVPVKPSPNLPNAASIYCYPGLCMFEGTIVSIGRGTDFPFQVVGHPDFKYETDFSFTPSPNDGASNPKLNNELCFGYDLRSEDILDLRSKTRFDLELLFEFYSALNLGKDFFLSNNFIDLLYGSDKLRKAMIAGDDLDSVYASWQPELNSFKELRKKYLLYEDFE